MSINSFGRILKVTSWGESHGPAIGCTIDGVPPKLNIEREYIQRLLNERRPGTSQHVTQRQERDEVQILSGVLDGKSTGMPICLLINNEDKKSKDYDEIKDKFRPGHADYTYWKKYGIYDHRGGGRASARETACRVAASAIARKILGSDILIKGAVIQMGSSKITSQNYDWEEAESNPLWCPDKGVLNQWEENLKNARKNLSSLGAVIEIIASGVPVGLGAPVYGKLDADLASAFMSINAVKGVEIGAGFDSANLDGKTMSGEMIIDSNNQPSFTTNHAGGILGGISNGNDIVLRFVVKPTSSIPQPIASITKDMETTSVVTKGRHDPCVGIRAVPVGKAMMALVLADHLLLAKAHNL